MGLLDAIFGNNQPPKINSILPIAAKNEIRAGRLPILNTDSLFLKRGEKIHYIDKAINLEIKVVKQYRHVGHSTPGLLKETKYLTVDLMNWYISSHNVGCPKHDGGELKGRLGKYGPYVTCTCGHTLKPHDI